MLVSCGGRQCPGGTVDDSFLCIQQTEPWSCPYEWPPIGPEPQTLPRPSQTDVLREQNEIRQAISSGQSFSPGHSFLSEENALLAWTLTNFNTTINAWPYIGAWIYRRSTSEGGRYTFGPLGYGVQTTVGDISLHVRLGNIDRSFGAPISAIHTHINSNDFSLQDGMFSAAGIGSGTIPIYQVTPQGTITMLFIDSMSFSRYFVGSGLDRINANDTRFVTPVFGYVLEGVSLPDTLPSTECPYTYPVTCPGTPPYTHPMSEPGTW